MEDHHAHRDPPIACKTRLDWAEVKGGGFVCRASSQSDEMRGSVMGITEGVFLSEGTFLPLPKLATKPFLKLWEHEVFALLLRAGKTTEDVMANMQSWKTWRYCAIRA